MAQDEKEREPHGERCESVEKRKLDKAEEDGTMISKRWTGLKTATSCSGIFK